MDWRPTISPCSVTASIRLSFWDLTLLLGSCPAVLRTSVLHSSLLAMFVGPCVIIRGRVRTTCKTKCLQPCPISSVPRSRLSPGRDRGKAALPCLVPAAQEWQTLFLGWNHSALRGQLGLWTRDSLTASGHSVYGAQGICQLLVSTVLGLYEGALASTCLPKTSPGNAHRPP